VSKSPHQAMAAGYMLDTNAFNKAARCRAISRAIVGRPVYTTHVQKGELASTSDSAVRALLLEAYGAIAAKQEPTDTAQWDDTPWDASYWSSTDGLYDRLLDRIREADKKKRKKSRDPMNQSRDARIGETAIRRSFALVSDDEGLAAAVRAEGGEAMTVAEFAALARPTTTP
jgi:hypothetical protein